MLPILTDPRLVAGVLALAVMAWALSTRQRIRRNRQRWLVFQRARDAIAMPHATTTTFTTTAERERGPEC